MDLKTENQKPKAAPVLSKAAQELEEAGPAAFGDPMGTPSLEERVLWKGRPDMAVLARTAFHTRIVGIYFTALVAISLALGNLGTALVCGVLGVLGVAILYGLAWLSARTTLYILTDTRLIMRIGMAIETRVNVPLKHIQSADLRERGNSHGDIAVLLGGERLLGYALLWPHARPWRFASPEPMLRAVPDAKQVAKMLAIACANHSPSGQVAQPVSDASQAASNEGLSDGSFQGATA